ncbi:hypothetical protein BGW39_010786 [Mortierella sp. 14UC]|nr:hypothetical protein BGW39_010786 [Mortierella sp. 14UC]
MGTFCIPKTPRQDDHRHPIRPGCSLIGLRRQVPVHQAESLRCRPNAFIIEYHDGVTRSNAHANRKKHAIEYRIRNEYGVFNGAAITVNSNHDGPSLASVPGPAKNNGNSTDPADMNILHMVGVDAVHKKLKLTERGIKVGVIDSGIDYKHPAFAAPGATERCFARYGKNCRDFVGDKYGFEDTPGKIPVPIPDGDPMDCMGPMPLIPWVAPEATLGAYRIFGCNGLTSIDIILAAMEMAFNDGMDAITGGLTISTPFGITLLSGVDALPMASIENCAGAAILAAYNNSPKNVLDCSKTVSSVMVDGDGAPADMSSYGLDGALRFKSDIAILHPYYVVSQALCYQYTRSKLSGRDIRCVFKSTATISKYYGSKSYVSAAKQGAGLINVWNTLTTAAHVVPDHIDLLDSIYFPKTQKITIMNAGKKSETYTLSLIPADALNSYSKGNTYPHARPIIEADCAFVIFAKKVNIAPGKSVKFTVRFTESKDGNAKQFPIHSEYIGNVRQVPIIDSDIGLPAMVVIQTNGTVIDVPQKDSIFNFNTAAPSVYVRFGSHSPTFTIRVFDATTKNGPGAPSIILFDGHGKVLETEDITAKPVQIGAGKYKLVVASQRKFTKGAYPADYEVFDLGNFNVTT